MTDKELLMNIIPLWYAERMWAEELLKRSFGFEHAQEILDTKYRGDYPLSGTNWRYRTHGVGVDIYRTINVGGIDFDFDKSEPDAWRLKIFFEKQYNEGNLSYELYRHLFEDSELLDQAINATLK